MKIFSLSDLTRHSDQVWNEALVDGVRLKVRGESRLVLIDAATYEKLVAARTKWLGKSSAEVSEDALEVPHSPKIR